MAISSSPNIKETVDTSVGLSSSYLLSLNQTAEGTISSSSDTDFYKVSLVRGQTYTFALIGTGLNDLPDPILKLKDSSGKILLSNDDSGVGYSSLITYTANKTGLFYLDVQDFYSNPGQYGLSFTQGSKASFNLSMAASACFTDSLVWGAAAGSATSITYGFRSAGEGTEQSETFSQLTSAQIYAVHSILNLWSDVANINFQEVNPGGYTDNATILFGNYSDSYDGAGAYAYYPGDRTSNSVAGDVWLNLAGGVDKNSVPEGSWTFEAILHEVGHAIGLSHPGDYNAGPGVSITYANSAQFIQDSTQYSVMSYFDGSNTGQYEATGITTPMMADIYQLQLLYGVNTTTRTGNTIYGFSNNTGSSIYSFSSSAIPLICIWDASGIDTLNCSGFSQNQLINLNEASFSNIGGGVTNVSIAFGAFIENATGGVGNDTILGNEVNNVLDGGLGSDTAVYQGNKSQYTITNNNGTWTITDSVSGRDGEDTISGIEKLQFSDTLFTLSAGSAITGTSGNDNLIGTSGDDLINGLAGNDTLNGGLGNDTMIGGDGDDILLGGGGSDTLYGDGGNDILWGSWLYGDSQLSDPQFRALLDADKANSVDGLYGGLGNDLYIFDKFSNTPLIYENTNEGTDTILGDLTSYTIGNNVENYINDLYLSYPDPDALPVSITGNNLDNIITTSPGGWPDPDEFNESWDLLLADAAFLSTFLSSNFSTLEPDDSIQARFYGMAGNDTLVSNFGDDLLDGGTGNDILMSGGGNDTLTGGLGNDTLNGGDGNDLFIVALTADHTATETINGGNGTSDEIRFTSTTASTLTLSSNVTNVENITIGTGTAATAVTTATTALNINAANLTYGAHITGNNGNNILTGTLGYNDTLIGGLGNDTYVINNAGDVVTEALGAGTDLIQSTISFTASDHIENLTLTGTSNINATGNSLNNTLTGNTGNNTLNGGAGNDIMVGGAGNDTYIVDSATDVVTEGSNAGADTIQTTLTAFSIASLANIENLSFAGIGNATLTGNTLNNVLTGLAGNDTLDGGSGNDNMVGGLGNDTYIVDNTSDVITEASSEGTDTIQSSVTFTASAHVENLTLTGSAAINGAGNTLDNNITGNSGINNLSGGDGNDLLFGGLGNDTLTGGAGADTFVFNTKLNARSNLDTITDFSHSDDTIQLSKSVMSALGATGTLSANDFKFSTQTLDTSDRIIYNQTSGALFYDGDGSGRSAAVQIALLNSLPTGIDNTDFVIV